MNEKDLLQYIDNLEKIVVRKQNRIRMMKANAGVDDHSRCMAYSMSTPVSQIKHDSRRLEKELKDIYQAPASAWSGQTSGRLPKLDLLVSLLGSVSYHSSLVGEMLDSIIQGQWVIKPESENADLNITIEHWVKRIKRSRTFDPGITITQKLNRYIPRLAMRECELFQIIFHILTNAVEALPSGKDGQIKIKTDINGNDAVFEVMDNGYGIRTDIQTKIFNPFYSTKGHKEPGEPHPGLGLYIADQIITSCKGRIELQSEQGIGTVISVFIPIMNAQGQPSSGKTPESASADKRNNVERDEISEY